MDKNIKENLFKGKFDKKKIAKGSDWFHDPSGEELEFVEIQEEKRGEDEN